MKANRTGEGKEMTRKGSLCPYCESGSLSPKRKSLAFDYKGRTKTLHDQKVYVCDVCDYETQNQVDFEKTQKALANFFREVDGLLSSDRLRGIREKLGMNKKEMAELLSVNPKTVGRYESGKVKQSSHIDKLYRFMEHCPEAICVIQKDYCQEGYEYIPMVKTVLNFDRRKKRKVVYTYSADEYERFGEVAYG
jgi:putative zinc finger/helix-turn-helix YgiT family protein